ncbi:hypothetical protein PG614_02560 [Riemerella anatipestifer]|nr:hypothetical protein [Riemerella anatipestifer]MDY3532623.1 hypothetical protein [Riemerella anatipestifer]MDY3534823.1 hypothetical protein [Riemerella anatipestifer]
MSSNKLLKRYSKNLETALYLASKEKISHQVIYQTLNENLSIEYKNKLLENTIAISCPLGIIRESELKEIEKYRNTDLKSYLPS